MSSYTDAISTFNPYVAQLPVELMAQVGMQKQAQYDAGIQKIQTKIDNVAGLDIMKDVDKTYLKSKLNQLGSDLTKVAAADFSNAQLVNSVGGMASQIGKDASIQSAVGSTAWYRKQAAEMEKARSEGKSSEANVYDFNNKANAWMESDKVGEKFNGRYTPYTDVKKKAMEAIKALHPNLQKYDIPFEIKDGKIDTTKIADAMKRYKIEGVDEGQIGAAITASLSSEDINQLSIEGNYQFRGVTPDQLIGIAQTNYKNDKDEAVATLKFLTEKKAITVDPTLSAKIDERIEAVQKQIGDDKVPGTLDSQLKDAIELATKNPEQVKASLYKDGFIKEFANAFTWKNQEESYETNPLKEQENFRTEMVHKQQVENRQRYEFGVTTNLRRQEIAMSAETLLLKKQELALKNAELYGVDAPWITLGNETDDKLHANDKFVDHVSSVVGGIDGNVQRLMNAGYTKEQVNMMLTKKLDIPAKAAGTIQAILKDQNYLKSLQSKEATLRAESDKEAGVTGLKAQLLTNKPGLDITFKGTKLQLSPEEILGIQSATKTTTQASKGGNRRTVTVDTQGFNQRQLNFVNSMKGVMYGSFEPGPKPAGYDAVIGQVNAVTGQYANAVTKLSSAVRKSGEIYNQKLAPLVTAFVPQIKALGSDKNGSPTATTLGQVSGLITATIARGVKADNVYDPSTASEMLQEKNSKDTRIFIQQSGDNFEVILKSESDPSKLQRIKATKEEVIANFGPKYVNNNTQESTRLKLGRGNTNITGNANNSMMQKSFGDFPGITKMNITADLDQDISNPDLYVPMINVMKKNGRWQTFALSGKNNLLRVGFDDGKAKLNALSDDQLLTSIKKEYPNYDYSQLDIK